MARALGRVENFVVKDGEVEREAEADRVRRREVDQRDVLRRFVGEQGGLRRVLAVGPGLELGEVAVVVALTETVGPGSGLFQSGLWSGVGDHLHPSPSPRRTFILR